jgi:hypothetical protein
MFEPTLLPSDNLADEIKHKLLKTLETTTIKHELHKTPTPQQVITYTSNLATMHCDVSREPHALHHMASRVQENKRRLFRLYDRMG